MNDDPYAERRKLTFEQAEGAEPLPRQLATKEMPQELRALLWRVVHAHLEHARKFSSEKGFFHLDEPWNSILCDYHVFHDHLMIDDYSPKFSEQIKKIKEIFQSPVYYKVFGFIQFVLRRRSCPRQFRAEIDQMLAYGRAAYRILDGDTIVPIASEEERKTLGRAFADLSSQEFQGARSHLRDAGEALTNGNFAGSVRESIHAVESVARILEKSGSFNGALTKLQKSAFVHQSLSLGFQKIYGYTSDEKGIRHPLLDDPSKVDETDALFMIGACAAFVSYLIEKARRAGLLPSRPTSS